MSQRSLLWGLGAASSLVLGAAIGVVRPWPDRIVGAILAFGAGALISAVSFDLALEGVREAGGLTPVPIGLAVGALVFFVGDAALDRMAERRGVSADTAAVAAGPAISLALGAFLDGLPENLVLGVGLSRGEGVSVASDSWWPTGSAASTSGW